MHACLNVDEIVRLVALELVAFGGEATAVCLACCCKSFEDPALDALWKKQGSLTPLLKSLPSDVWKEGGYSSFKRLPTTTEWARLRKYARRIRELRHRNALKTPPLKVFSHIQLGTANEHLFPNLETLELWGIEERFSIPFIPLLLSPRTTTIALKFQFALPKSVVTSTITTLSTLCPELQAISLISLPTDPTITTTIFGTLLAASRNTLQKLDVDSPLTMEASEVLYELPNLRSLSVVIKKGTTPPSSASLPNLTELKITCHDEDGWQGLFHGATFGKLKSVFFYPQFEQIGDFLGAFERAALSSSVQNTLSKFHIFAWSPWNPTYYSLLPFTQLVDLTIGFPCEGRCSSRVDDDIVINLSRAMPKLKRLRLGNEPCYEPITGVTAKGLVALAHNCRDLSLLRIHLQVASLGVPLAGPGVTPNAESTVSWTDCALTNLEVGKMIMPETSMLMVALTLLRIFPRLIVISGNDPRWAKVSGAMYHSKGIVDRSRATLENGG